MKIKIRGANTLKYRPNNFRTDSHNSSTNHGILPADIFFDLFMDSQNLYEARHEKSRKASVKQNFASLVVGYHKSANICPSCANRRIRQHPVFAFTDPRPSNPKADPA